MIPSQLQARFAPRPHLRTRNVPSFSKRRSRSLSFAAPTQEQANIFISHFHISHLRLPDSASRICTRRTLRVVSNQLQTPLAPPFISLRVPRSPFPASRVRQGNRSFHKSLMNHPFHKVQMHIHYLHTCTNSILRFPTPPNLPPSPPLL